MADIQKIVLKIALILVIVSLQGMVAAMVGPSQCDDGIDNDGDGAADYPGDCGCVSQYDNDESDCCTNCSPEPIFAIAAVMALAPVLAYGLVRISRKQNKKQ